MDKDQIIALLKEIAAEQAKAVKSTLDMEFEAYKKELKDFLVKKPEQGEDPRSGFKSFTEFIKAVYREGATKGREVDDRLLKSAGTGANELGDPEYGGFLVPVEWRNTLLEYAIENSNILARCQSIPMATNSIDIPASQGATQNASTLYGGIRWYWTDEEGSLTETRPKFEKINLKLKKLAGLCYVSDELLQDSPISIEPLLTRMFGTTLTWTLDDVFINGNGAGQPLGIMNSPCLITVSKESGQASNTLNYLNIVKMYARQLNKSNAVWFANSNVLPQLMQMQIAISTAGGAVVFQPAGGASASPYNTLFGRPLVFTDACKGLTTTGDIIFADWSQYLVGQKSNAVQSDMSIHLKFDYMQTAFRYAIRLDGQPWMKTYVTPRNGDTLSPFIALETR